MRLFVHNYLIVLYTTVLYTPNIKYNTKLFVHKWLLYCVCQIVNILSYNDCKVFVEMQATASRYTYTIIFHADSVLTVFSHAFAHKWLLHWYCIHQIVSIIITSLWSKFVEMHATASKCLRYYFMILCLKLHWIFYMQLFINDCLILYTTNKSYINISSTKQ